MSRSLGWYVRRLRGMSPAEVGWRVGDRVRQALWARRRVPSGAAVTGPVPGLLTHRTFAAVLPASARAEVPAAARDAVVAAADRLLAGDWTVLGVLRHDLVDPDWFLDPVTGRRAPQDGLAFRIDHRDEGVTGNVKSVWELSRHHHLTVLAAAYWLTGDERYAERVAAQLRSWWAANPFLSGVHWTSGIELGIRLTSWVWVRRLLDGWPGASSLFEDDDEALRQVRWHQEYLAAFRSRGSSANNHAVAEAVGRLVGACAFPWFEESERWGAAAAAELETTLAANTFSSGVNREQATDYHRFVTELGLLALAEADRAGRPLEEPTRRLLASSLDAAAALLDTTGRPPRQGDGDDGRGLVLDAPGADPWAQLLATGAAIVGAGDWWPPIAPGVASTAVGALASRAEVRGRPQVRPRAFHDAGTHVLRTPAGAEPEIWCRCDGGPHGFGSIAAHGQADALSVEVRVGGIDVLADPGTYCYHGDPDWRTYFRSTLGHNTVEVDGTSQSVEGGPFLWTSSAVSGVDDADLAGDVQTWSGHHLGYTRLDPVLRHDRQVTLDSGERTLRVEDTLTGSARHTLRLAWHLGPDVDVELGDGVAELSWADGMDRRSGRLSLPPQLSWTAHRGETSPVLGWYSPRFGERVPSATLVGSGAWTGVLSLTSVLELSVVPTLVAQHAGSSDREVAP
ncbi:alginate lyase family protein [Nostocoides sp. HKS02]|uniref:alginate lyase family protein n=1 Tax=Nostocoides sp. HKS02 TaxID=1813880 RepID=UPI0012B4E50B|nr:alginate lyase family protein [Tetrasphaera sp. HKS02]QGN59147.1 heparinase [Tetrasphaera sp. HKS02]